MGSSWSVFAVKASEVSKLPSAVTGLDLKQAKLIVGRAIPAVGSGECWVAFGIEHQGWRFLEPVSDDDLPAAFFGAFEALVSMHGNSNSDYVTATLYASGTPRIRENTTFGVADLLPLLPRMGFNLMALCQWANFGISGAELSGVSYPLQAPIPPIDGASFSAEPVSIKPSFVVSGSFDALWDAHEQGTPHATGELALWMYQTGDDIGEGIYMMEDVLNKLEEGPLKAEIRAVLALVGR